MKKTINGIEFSVTEWIHHGFRIGFIVWEGNKQSKISGHGVMSLNDALDWVINKG